MYLKETESRRPARQSMAATAAEAFRKSRDTGVTPGTADRHARRFRSIVSNCVHAANGVMDLGEGPRKTTVRRFDDHSLLAHPEGEMPKTLTRIEDKNQAEEILNTDAVAGRAHP